MNVDGVIDVLQVLDRHTRDDRLAVAALVACFADDLDSAIERAREVRESLPAPRTGKDWRKHKTFNRIAKRTIDTLDTAIGDLERIQAKAA